MSKKDPSVCEEKNFDTLFNAHFESARNYLYYKCGDIQQAEDIVQDAFVKLWKQCADIIYATAKSLIFKMCNNALLNEFAHKKVVLRYEKSARDDKNYESPDFIMETEEFREKLERSIAKLSPKEREVFLLSRIDKKTYKEIAEITNISVKAVEKRMSKAFIALQKLLGDEIKI